MNSMNKPNKPHHRQKIGWLLLGTLLAALSLAVWIAVYPIPIAQAAAVAQPYDIFLPLTLTGSATDPGDEPGDDDPGDDDPGDEEPEEPVAANALFLDEEIQSGSADIAIDPQGGVHTAFYFYQEVEGVDTPVMIYLYCAGPIDTCGNVGSGKWSGITAFSNVYEVQLELTAQGRPRILVRASSSDGSGSDYIYLECNQNCTDPEQWAGDVVISTSGTAVWDVTHIDMPQRYFALDPQGRPRFVYFNRNFIVEPDLYGGFYAWCDANCADPANWQTANMTSGWDNEYFDFEPLTYASLTFTPEGNPRVVGELDPFEAETGIYYFECNGNCGELESWQRARLSDRGQGQYRSWDIALTADGRPRVVYYPAALPNDAGEQLYYASCERNCLNPSNWQHVNLGIGTLDGQGPDLALDAQGRPRVAYAMTNGGGLGYSWCNGNCASAANWQHQVVENRTDLYDAWPVAYPPHCDGGIWDGRTPVLHLDADGTVQIAYDTYYNTRCWYDDENDSWEPIYNFHVIQRAVRVAYFPQP